MSILVTSATGVVLAGPLFANAPNLSITLLVPNGTGIVFTLTAYAGLNGTGAILYKGSTAANLTGAPVTIPIQMNLSVAVSAAPATNIVRGQMVTLTGTVSGAAPTATSSLLWSKTGGVLGVPTANGATVTWTAPNTVGVYTITAQIDPNVNPLQDPTAVGTAVLTVINRAPVVSLSSTAVSLAEGGNAALTATAVDADGDPYAFSLANAPAWATITAAGAITLAPPAGSAGVYVMQVLATDALAGVGSGTLTVTVTTAPQTGSISGTVIDATSLAAIAGATVNLHTGANNTNGAVVATTTSSGAGQYAFANLAAGSYTVAATKAGFSQNSANVVVATGAQTNAGNLPLSPLLGAGQVRIVLSWGASPTDLDSHLVGPVDSGSSQQFHVYYGRTGSSTAAPFAKLDVDVTSGFGPETITISQLKPGTYRYHVYDFDDTGTLSSTSNATVKVFVGTASAPSAVFNVPAGQVGDVWTVFDLDGQTGQVTPINSFGMPQNILARVTISPATATVIQGATQQMTAIGELISGSSNLTATANWSSSNQAAATVSAGGLVSPTTAGGLTSVRATDAATGYSATAKVMAVPAPMLLGQSDSLGVANANAVFDAGGSNDTNPYGLNTTEGMDIDPVGHRLFVADRGQNRILVFQLDALNHIASRKAVAVLGHADFEHADTDRGGAASANTLDSPNDVSYYNDGVNKWLLVADRDNNRILIYDITAGVTNGMSAAKVLGQTTFTTTAAGITQSKFNLTRSAKVATVGTQTVLFASDGANDRVLGWNITAGGLAALTNGQAADYVLGQPDFITNGTVRNQSSLDNPKGMTQWNNILFVADYVNDRVLGFDLGVNAGNLIAAPQGMAASFVLGQANFTTNGAAVNQSSLNGPTFMAIDSQSNLLFVSDWSDDRVVVFNLATLANGMNASFVYGQANFTSTLGAVGQNRLDGPDGLAVAPGQRLFVGEDTNDRIVSYDLATLPASIVSQAYGPNALNVIGQSDWIPGTPDGNETGLFDANGSSDVGVVGVKNPGDSVLGAVQGTNYLFVADAGNSRVLAFAADANGAPLDMQADFVLGQVDFDHVAATTTASSLRKPTGVAFDAATSRLFVSDELDDRIVVYDLGVGIGNGMAAGLVLGQTTFTGHFSGRSSTTVNTPKRMAVGTVGGVKYLFVADNVNDRVLMFNISGAITNGMAASFVLGQVDFISNGTTASQTELTDPEGVDFDQASGRLFVADGIANRVMIWDLSPGVVTNGMAATNVIGQTTFTSTASGLAANRFNNAVDAAFDSTRGILWVSDYSNNRLTGFELGAGITNGMSAGFVIGQPDFVTSAARTEEKVAGVTTGKERDGFALERPFGIHASSGGHLYVPEDFGDRLVIY
jgi:hypothetical protein